MDFGNLKQKIGSLFRNKKFQNIIRTIIIIGFLIFSIESNKYWLFFIGICSWGAYRLRDQYKSFIFSYWIMLKKAWNREQIDLQSIVPQIGSQSAKDKRINIKKEKKRSN